MREERSRRAAAHHRPDPEILARCTELRALQVALALVIYEDFGDMVGRDEEKEAYVSGEPTDDARFVDGIAHSLEHTGGYAPEEAKRVAETMLPDILPYNPTHPVAYPDNARLLTDDVADPFVAILTNGKATEDKVGPHNDLLPEFPYLGPPHENRTEV